jgi:hypothetical protein
VCRGSDGTCVTDDCVGFPDRCSAGELCVAGVCESNPCFGVACSGEDEYCFEGDCVQSCAGITCAEGELCVLGDCEDDPCDGSCTSDQVCNDSGDCVQNPCLGVNCGAGQACDTESGECERNPCLGVDCPGNQACVSGSCFDPPTPDAGPEDEHTFVAPGGGGCSTSGQSNGWSALLLIGIALLISRGARRGGRR